MQNVWFCDCADIINELLRLSAHNQISERKQQSLSWRSHEFRYIVCYSEPLSGRMIYMYRNTTAISINRRERMIGTLIMIGSSSRFHDERNWSRFDDVVINSVHVVDGSSTHSVLQRHTKRRHESDCCSDWKRSTHLHKSFKTFFYKQFIKINCFIIYWSRFKFFIVIILWSLFLFLICLQRNSSRFDHYVINSVDIVNGSSTHRNGIHD
jgi:hypothetical protein